MGIAATCWRLKRLGWRPTTQGKAVIARHLADLDAAEARVNAICFAWRKGISTPLDRELDTMLPRWRALGDGEELVVRWRIERARRRRQSAG